jgi:predicted histone-like DNA-binding protein
MSQKFRVIEHTMPGDPGKKMFYAMAVSGGESTMEDITNAIERRCTVSGADIRAVLYAIAEVTTEFLHSGMIVRIGELGSFRLSLSSEGRERPEEVNASIIRSASILFSPGLRIKRSLKSIKYEKL